MIRTNVLLLILLLAMPAALASDDPMTAEQWLAKTVAKARQAGFSGVQIKKFQKGDYTFAKVLAVHQDSPAAAAGLQAGDVVMAINGVQLKTGDDGSAVKKSKISWKPGTEHTYIVQRREGEEWVKKSITLTLSEPPESAVAEMVGKAVLAKMAGEAKSKKKLQKKQ